MTSGQLSVLDSHIFAIIAKLKQQSKSADIDSIHAHIVKAVDFEDITKGNLQERINSLLSDGKVVNKSNRNKDFYWINLDLVGITNESTLNLSHNFLPNTPTAVHVDLSSSPISHTEPTANGPTPDFNIVEETSKTFRRFERIEMDNLKNELILETERNINMRFQKELATFKNECKKLITMSHENSKSHVENLEKEIRRKDSIIDQLLLDLQKILTKRNCHPQAEASEDHQEIASVEYNINPPKHSQKIEADAKPSNTETRGTIPKKKGRIDYQIKEFRKQCHQKYIHSKIPIPEKNVIPTTSEVETNTTASSPSNPFSVTKHYFTNW